MKMSFGQGFQYRILVAPHVSENAVQNPSHAPCDGRQIPRRPGF